MEKDRVMQKNNILIVIYYYRIDWQVRNDIMAINVHLISTLFTIYFVYLNIPTLNAHNYLTTNLLCKLYGKENYQIK